MYIIFLQNVGVKYFGCFSIEQKCFLSFDVSSCSFHLCVLVNLFSLKFVNMLKLC